MQPRPTDPDAGCRAHEPVREVMAMFSADLIEDETSLARLARRGQPPEA
jgi:hypothetical protein